MEPFVLDEVIHGLGHLAGSAEAIVRGLREGPHQDGVEGRGHGGVLGAGRIQLAVLDLLQGGEVGLAKEQALAGEQLVEHGAEGEDVGAVIDGQAADQLRAHVPKLAFEHARLGLLAALERALGDAEVDELDGAVIADEHVLGADVPVHDLHRGAVGALLVVGVVEALCDPGPDVGHEGDRQPVAGLAEVVVERQQIPPADVLHGDVVVVLDPPKIKDLGDVVVGELHGHLGLADEHVDELLILGEVGEDPLDGHEAAEALHAKGPGLEDLGHAADADALEEQVLAEGDRALTQAVFLASAGRQRSR